MADHQLQVGGTDLRRAGHILKRRRLLIALCMVLAGASAYLLDSTKVKEYTASASLLFRDPGLDQTLFGSNYFAPVNDPTREAATNLKLVSLETVSSRTARQLRSGFTPEGVQSSVQV